MPESIDPIEGSSGNATRPHQPLAGQTRESIAEGLAKALDVGKSGLDTMIEGYREHLRLVVSFFDKLVILNGGTLAITFSALFAFHNSNPKGKIDTADLFIAWKLLIASTVAALLCSWLNIAVVSVQTKATEQLMMRAYLTASTMKLNSAIAGAQIDVASLMPSDKEQKKLKHSLTGTQWIGNVARWLGLAAKLATVTSYYYLYLFAQASASVM